MPEKVFNDNVKRRNHRYRLVIINDDTFEELAQVKLNRFKVYAFLSMLFLILIATSLALVSFTSLKYLIPGYGTRSNTEDLRQLKIQADSLAGELVINQRYMDGIKRVLSGDTNKVSLDTTLLSLPPADTITD